MVGIVPFIAMASAISTYAPPVAIQGTKGPLTRAERTGFAETSHYDDVIAFLQELQRTGAPIQVEYMGESAEGKQMPLVIAYHKPIASLAELRASQVPVIYIQANIHAGEVEGKEAAMMMLRDWCSMGSKGPLGKAVIVMAPIYNIDGNEKFGPMARNRPGQNGPELVGMRANGQGLDLNRDCMKAVSPEMRAVLSKIYNTWDPDVVFDLHTTDGTRHGYRLTYSPPLNPNTEPTILKRVRDQILPTVRTKLRKTGLELFDYGNSERRGDEMVWGTFGFEGRYVTNYAGLRNRIGILSEATTYATFKQRVLDTIAFVTGCMDELLAKPSELTKLTRAADAQVVSWGQDPSKAPALGVAFEMASRGVEGVLLEKRQPAGSPRPTGMATDIETIKMPVLDRFRATKTAPFPSAYLFPAEASKVAELLRMHGIVVEKFVQDWSGTVDRFDVSKVNVAPNAFQGVRITTFDGAFSKESFTAPAGSFLVRTAQPLGVLAFEMLEPQASDGAAAWGFFGSMIQDSMKVHPVRKTFVKIDGVTVRIL